MTIWKKSLLTGLFAMTSIASWQTVASPITFSGVSGNLSASASFDIVAGNLQVKLANTSATDTSVSADLLTGVFFTVAGNPALTRISALSGDVTHTGTTINSAAGTVVGGEWAYLNGLSQYGANSGISSSGLGIFGAANFPGANLAGPSNGAVSSFEYGIGSAGDNFSTGNPALLATPITSNSVIFTLGGLVPGFSLTDISGITFQYGTSLTEPSFRGTPNTGRTTQIPEPGTLALLGLGLAGLGAFRTRKTR